MTKKYDPEARKVLTAFAMSTNGPGWNNTPIVAVTYKMGMRDIELEWIEPDKQTAAMQTLFPVATIIHGQLVREVAFHLKMDYYS